MATVVSAVSAVFASAPKEKTDFNREDYYATLRIMAEMTPPPVLTTLEGKKVMIALQHKNTPVLRQVVKRARKIDHCQTCEERVLKLFPLSIPDKDGNIVPLFLNPTTTPKPYQDLARRNQEYCHHTDITGIRILTGSDEYLFDFAEEQGVDPKMEGRLFHHFYKLLPSQKTELDPEETNLLHKAFHRYCPRQLPDMLETLLPLSKWTLNNGLFEMIKDIKTSLECIRDAIPEITYGENIRLSVSWLWRVVERFESMGKMPDQLTVHHRWLFCAEILLWTTISPDGLDHQNAVSCVIQQAHNNVIPVMSSAKDRSALIKILNHRLSPENYQRRTAAPSEGQINNAIHALGDFTNTIMTLEEAAQIPGAVIVGVGIPANTKTSSMSAFDAMKKEAKTATAITNKKKNPWGLAERCSEPQIQGLKDLVKYARDHPQTPIYLDASGMVSVYVASTTLSKEMCCVPYMWCFLQDTMTKIFTFPSPWAEIAVILPQYETTTYHNTLFLLRGALRVPSDLKNCCFPEFLSIASRRVCGPAFEKLNEKIRLSLPTAEPAIGRGTSASRGETLIKPIRVRVEGREYTLTTM